MKAWQQYTLIGNDVHINKVNENNTFRTDKYLFATILAGKITNAFAIRLTVEDKKKLC